MISITRLINSSLSYMVLFVVVLEILCYLDKLFVFCLSFVITMHNMYYSLQSVYFATGRMTLIFITLGVEIVSQLEHHTLGV